MWIFHCYSKFYEHIKIKKFLSSIKAVEELSISEGASEAEAKISDIPGDFGGKKGINSVDNSFFLLC